MNQQQSILTVPWVVYEEPAALTAERDPSANVETADLEALLDEAPASRSRLLAMVIVTFAWVGIIAVMAVIAAAFGAFDVVLYIGAVGALVLVAVLIIACPRDDDEQELFWTLGSEAAAYGQCTPSRHSVTGRR